MFWTSLKIVTYLPDQEHLLQKFIKLIFNVTAISYFVISSNLLTCVHFRFYTFHFNNTYFSKTSTDRFEIWTNDVTTIVQNVVKKSAKTDKNCEFYANFTNAPFFLAHPV